MSIPTARAYGIDVGADRLHVADSHDKKSKVYILELEDPNWWRRLAEMIAPGDIVALEPTGWHYAAPVMAVLQQIGARILLVEHRVTGKMRDMKQAGGKNDRTDARALQFLASTHDREAWHGVNDAAFTERAPAMSLRMLMFSYRRADKEVTRTNNRLRQMAHSIFPALDQHLETYKRALSIGVAAPCELRAFVAQLRAIDAIPKKRERVYPDEYDHGGTRAPLYGMVDKLPDWLENDFLPPIILDDYRTLARAEKRKSELTREIDAMIWQAPFAELTELWMSVPLMGAITCAGIHAATRGMARVMEAGEFRSVLGSHPVLKASGVVEKTKVTFNGFRPAKAYLHMLVMNLIRSGENPVNDTYQYHKARGEKFARQKARSKLVNILYGIARTGTPYNADLHIERHNGTGGR